MGTLDHFAATAYPRFSKGLAATMVAVVAAAALSVQHASKRCSGLGEIAGLAPYFSSVLIILVGLYTAYLGPRGLGVTHFLARLFLPTWTFLQSE